MANIIKIRDDSACFLFNMQEDEFSLVMGEHGPSWLPSGNTAEIKLSDLRSGIEPWLTSLFQSEHLSLLTGNGLSTAVQYLAEGTVNSAMSWKDIESTYKDRIIAAANNGAKKTDVEKQILKMRYE